MTEQLIRMLPTAAALLLWITELRLNSRLRKRNAELALLVHDQAEAMAVHQRQGMLLASLEEQRVQLSKGISPPETTRSGHDPR